MIFLIFIGWILSAAIIAAVSFLPTLFWFKFKKTLFFALALSWSVFLSVKFGSIAKIFAYSVLQLLGIYIGLFFLIAIKNMAAKCQFCRKIGDKFRRKF